MSKKYELDEARVIRALNAEFKLGISSTSFIWTSCGEDGVENPKKDRTILVSVEERCCNCGK